MNLPEIAVRGILAKGVCYQAEDTMGPMLTLENHRNVVQAGAAFRRAHRIGGRPSP